MGGRVAAMDPDLWDCGCSYGYTSSRYLTVKRASSIFGYISLMTSYTLTWIPGPPYMTPKDSDLRSERSHNVGTYLPRHFCFSGRRKLSTISLNPPMAGQAAFMDCSQLSYCFLCWPPTIP